MTARHREKAIEPEYTELKYSDNGVLKTGTPLLSRTESWEMDDYVDPNFHERVAKGEVFCNPCVLTVNKYYWSTESASCSYWSTSNPSYVVICPLESNLTAWVLTKAIPFYGYNQAPSSIEQNYDAVAQAKHYAMAHVDSTPYEFFEDLLEVRETIQFLQAPLESLKALNDVFNRRREKIIRRLRDDVALAKALANLWKQYRFAAAPLVRSILTSWEAGINWDNVERPKRRTAHGFAQSEGSLQPVRYEPFVPAGGGDYRIIAYSVTDTAEVDAHASIYYEVTNPIVDWKFKLGLRFKDVPTVLWELFPRSFMYDRLFDIKGMIKGFINIIDPRVQFLSGASTTKTSSTREIRCLGQWTSLGTLTYAPQNYTDSVFYSEFQYRRDKWEPALGDIVPVVTWKNTINEVNKVLDLLSFVIGSIPRF